MVVEDFTFDTPRTKDFIAATRALKLDGKKIVLVLNDVDRNVYLSSRNVPEARIVTARELNTYRILDNKMLVITESSVETLNKF